MSSHQVFVGLFIYLDVVIIPICTYSCFSLPMGLTQTQRNIEICAWQNICHSPEGMIELKWHFVNKSAFQVFAGLLIYVDMVIPMCASICFHLLGFLIVKRETCILLGICSQTSHRTKQCTAFHHSLKLQFIQQTFAVTLVPNWPVKPIFIWTTRNTCTKVVQGVSIKR